MNVNIIYKVKCEQIIDGMQIKISGIKTCSYHSWLHQ